MNTENTMKIHHIGCLVEDIEKAKNRYLNELHFKGSTETFVVSSQNVAICLIDIGNNTLLELVQPLTECSLHKMLNKGINYYHIGYLVDDIESVVLSLLDKNYYLVNKFYCEAFNNKKCVFLYTPERHMIELIQE